MRFQRDERADAFTMPESKAVSHSANAELVERAKAEERKRSQRIAKTLADMPRLLKLKV